MLLTAIWNVLSKLEPYSADGYFNDQPVTPSMVITKSQALNLLKLRGYVIKYDVLTSSPQSYSPNISFFAAFMTVCFLYPFFILI